MKSKSEKICIIIVIVCLVLAGLVMMISLVPKSGSARAHFVTVRSTVTVYEGSVVLYKLDESNRRVFLRIVNKGETAEVASKKRVRGDGGIFGFLKPLMRKGVVYFIVGEIEHDSHAVHGTSVFIKSFKEDEFTRRMNNVLDRKMPVSNISIKFSDNEFSGSARLSLKFIQITVTGRALLSVDQNEHLFLKIYEAHLGPIPVPRFILTQLEDVFYQYADFKDMQLQILKVSLRSQQMELNYRKVTS